MTVGEGGTAGEGVGKGAVGCIWKCCGGSTLRFVVVEVRTQFCLWML